MCMCNVRGATSSSKSTLSSDLLPLEEAKSGVWSDSGQLFGSQQKMESLWSPIRTTTILLVS